MARSTSRTLLARLLATTRNSPSRCEQRVVDLTRGFCVALQDAVADVLAVEAGDRALLGT